MVLLGVAAASGLTMLILILVKATNVLLPADTKVWLRDLTRMLHWVTRMYVGLNIFLSVLSLVWDPV